MEAGAFYDNRTIRTINFYKLFTDSVTRIWKLAREKGQNNSWACEFNIKNIPLYCSKVAKALQLNTRYLFPEILKNV